MAGTAIRGVVFDSDGTLLNSFEMIMAAYRHVAATHGLAPPTVEAVKAQLGKALPAIYGALYPGHTVDELVHTNSEFVAENAMRSEAFDGLEDMLRTLHDDMHLRLGILTGGNHKVHDLLAHHKISHYFSSVVHCDRGVKPKPDPEGLLLAADECGVPVDSVVMVGDTIADVTAGKRADVRVVIGVTHGIGTRDDLLGAGADYLADSLPEVLEVIQRLSEESGRD